MGFVPDMSHCWLRTPMVTETDGDDENPPPSPARTACLRASIIALSLASHP